MNKIRYYIVCLAEAFGWLNVVDGNIVAAYRTNYARENPWYGLNMGIIIGGTLSAIPFIGLMSMIIYMLSDFIIEKLGIKVEWIIISIFVLLGGPRLVRYVSRYYGHVHNREAEKSEERI